MVFRSPTWGSVTCKDMVAKIRMMSERTARVPTIIVGADSQRAGNGVKFVCAVTAYFPGKGGIYFYRVKRSQARMGLAERMFREASLSLEIADILRPILDVDSLFQSSDGHVHLEIHLDLGPNGKTRDVLTSVVGMVRGCGYTCRTKPDSFVATKIADKHSK